eukprot:NODE_208_length_12861_cov_0.800972.p10 type:complete len:122 gc:universal NODE_208_length_12861_cov_0.800972:993-1358(+)
MSAQTESNNENKEWLPSLSIVLNHANIDYNIRSQPVSQSSILDDISLYTTNNNPERKCPHCDKVFKNIHAKKKHETSVHGPKLPCEYCGKMLKVYGRHDLMKQHLDRCKKYKLFLDENISK